MTITSNYTIIVLQRVYNETYQIHQRIFYESLPVLVLSITAKQEKKNSNYTHLQLSMYVSENNNIVDVLHVHYYCLQMKMNREN